MRFKRNKAVRQRKAGVQFRQVFRYSFAHQKGGPVMRDLNQIRDFFLVGGMLDSKHTPPKHVTREYAHRNIYGRIFFFKKRNKRSVNVFAFIARIGHYPQNHLDSLH